MQWKKFWIITIVFNLILFVVIANAEEGVAKLEWNLHDTACVGYVVYWGIESGVYKYRKDVGNVFHAEIEMASLRHAYMAVACYDINGNESKYTNEEEWGVKKPTGIHIIE